MIEIKKSANNAIPWTTVESKTWNVPKETIYKAIVFEWFMVIEKESGFSKLIRL